MTARKDGWTQETTQKWETSKATLLAAGQRAQAGPEAGCQGELEAHLLEDNFNRKQNELPSLPGKAGGDQTHGTDSLLHERSGGRMWFICSSCFTSRNKTQELEERD